MGEHTIGYLGTTNRAKANISSFEKEYFTTYDAEERITKLEQENEQLKNELEAQKACYDDIIADLQKTVTLHDKIITNMNAEIYRLITLSHTQSQPAHNYPITALPLEATPFEITTYMEKKNDNLHL